MNWNETLEKALRQARDLQSQMSEAMLKASDEMKPRLAESLKQAQELQTTLQKHASETSEIASQHAQTMIGHLGEFIKTGGEAMRQSTEQTRAMATKMTEHAQKVVDAASAAIGKKPE